MPGGGASSDTHGVFKLLARYAVFLGDDVEGLAGAEQRERVL
jgi:hypothetical protein